MSEFPSSYAQNADGTSAKSGLAPPTSHLSPLAIHIHGARQNNLKNLSIALPLNELIVVTGVSGSGKSSLVFDTLYAEGQRRYVETFSPYARQFLDRMDKPQVDAIHGIPPAIAIDQTNPVRTSRSTVGTMTELNDHLKLLFARAARLYCSGCGQEVSRDTPDTVYETLAARARAAGDPRLIVTFPVTVPKNFSEKEVLALLAAQGYTRIHQKHKPVIEMVQDRLRLGSAERVRRPAVTRV
jgi:excinuclease ABC subunit A